MVSTRRQTKRNSDPIELTDRTATQSRSRPESPADGWLKRPSARQEDSNATSREFYPSSTKSTEENIDFDSSKASFYEPSIPTATKETDIAEARNHTRFDSEEPSLDPSKNATSAPSPITHDSRANGPTLSEDDESEDEAPEAITVAIGHQSARAAQLDIEKALQSQRQIAKDARRKKDVRLKSQASDARKANQNLGEGRFAGNGEPTKTHPQDVITGELPEFLPADILAAEPSSEQTSVALAAVVSSKPRTKTEFSKSYKDVRSGGRTIRILEKTTSLLPPRTSKVSKTVRETWLRGSKGGLQRGIGYRTSMNSGFLRR